MKKLLKSGAFSTAFLFCVTFGLLYSLVQWAAVKIQYPVSAKTDAEISLAASAIFILLKIGSSRNKKREYKNIEYGSSRWGTKKDLADHIDPDFSANVIFSQTEFLAMDRKFNGKGCNCLVLGGTGSGKSRFFALPNIMQMNASYVVTDPSGELLRNTGKMLEDNGYKVKVFDVEHMGNSLHFNPFHYYKTPEEIMKLTQILISNTNGGRQKGVTDANFWDNCENLWFLAHIAYIQEACLEEEKNIKSLLLLLDNSKIKEEDEDYKNAVDILFAELEQENPDSFAVRQYKKFKLGAGKSLKSILLSVAVRLTAFDIPEVSRLLSDDELELEKMGEEKTALFIIVSDTDRTYNFIVAILLDVLVKLLSNIADKTEPDHRLKIPVRFIIDEIANIGYFQDLPNTLSVIRKRGMSLEMLFQNLGQMKALYRDHWETIESNCIATLFLGGNGEETTKYVSRGLLGKATIDTVSYGSSGNAASLGKNSYNSNEQKTGRYLEDETELAHLDESECITCVQNLPPFKGKKYKPEMHPNYRSLAESNPANTYRSHQGTDLRNAEVYSITLDLNEKG